MNYIRAKFEEIWPMPAGLQWNERAGEYRVRTFYNAWGTICNERNARLDTFTLCQETMFSKEELNLFRQWFNAVEDLSPAYLEKSDCDLYRKVMEALK